MKLYLFLFLALFSSINLFSQESGKSIKQELLESLSVNACKCIDSINVYNKSKSEVTSEVNKCIDDQTGAYQVGVKLLGGFDLGQSTKKKEKKKQINISINMDKNSDEYKVFYYEMERYLMDSCKAIKNKIATNEKQNEHSISNNPEAMDFYSKGIIESESDNLNGAISYFEKAVKIDSRFAFAWDNMGLCYRKLENYDKALEAYNKSLEIDPEGIMPLQNIAVVYQFKKEYEKAIETYNKLAKLDSKNPEIFYGIGQVYVTQLKNYSKGLPFLCRAYNLYVEQKSAYRTDAEKLIQIVYSEMKKEGKENEFLEILKEFHISID